MTKKLIVQSLLGLSLFVVLACGQSSGNAPSISSSGGGSGGGGGGGGVVATDCTASACNMFITNRTFPDANIGGPSAADGYCASDSMNPNDGSTYKALVVSAGVRTFTTDWVLYPNHTYKRLASDGSFTIGTTDANSKFSTTLDNDVSSNKTASWITGINISKANGSWNVGSYTCSGLTSTTGTFAYGTSGTIGDNEQNFGITLPSGNGQGSPCDGSGIGVDINNIRLLCVQQ